jgi:phosphomannomutase
LTLAAFAEAGFEPPYVVAEQLEPDPRFPTVDSPNPEEANAQQLARGLAAHVDADVALIHDPDADRLGVLSLVDGEWRSLNGNEIGLLLADHLLDRTESDDRLVVDTVVSSSALGALAKAHHVHHARTLTGFKWIVRPAIEHPEWRFVFGYEEALGFSVDAFVRDKDGIS